MEHALRLVRGGREIRAVRHDPPPATPQLGEARAVVEAWLDAPSFSAAHAIDDLVARIAAVLTERDARHEPSAVPLER